MSERIVNDPSQHGWVEEGGKWAWGGEGSGAAPVTSVNTKIGDVVLDAADVGALPDTYSPPNVNLDGYATEAYVGEEIAKIPTPPKAPVDSVNGKTGAVSLTHTDVGALPSSYTPPAAPVASVNGKTGAVSLSAADVDALPTSYEPPYAKRMMIGDVGVIIGSSYGFGGTQPFLMPCNQAGTYINTGMLGMGQTTQWSVLYSASFYKNGSPMLAAVELIDTFATIKSAISQEDTVEGLRSSVLSGLDAVIAKLQAMEDLAEEEGHKQ